MTEPVSVRSVSVQEWVESRGSSTSTKRAVAGQGTLGERYPSSAAISGMSTEMNGLQSTVYAEYEQPWLQPNKFVYVDERSSSAQILITNPYPFFIRCKATCCPCDENRNLLRATYETVAEISIDSKRTASLMPSNCFAYRFHFSLDPTNASANERTTFVSVNLPPGVDFDLYYSVKAAEVKRNGPGGMKYAGRKKFWIDSAIDEEELSLLDRLVVRRGKSNRHRRVSASGKTSSNVAGLNERVQVSSKHIARSNELKEIVRKKLAGREEQILQFREQLSSYRNFVRSHREETLEMLDVYRKRYSALAHAVRSYSLESKEKNKRQTSKMMHHMRRRIQNSLERGRDHKKEMIINLESEVSHREKNIFSFHKKINSIFLKLTKFFIEGIGLVMEIPYARDIVSFFRFSR